MTAFESNVVIVLTLTAFSFGYDGYTSCSRPYRTSKARPEPPCDFQHQSWCTIPGSAYPWHAVRRFVHENQGLMRRMYGEQRHISVLRAEIESNDVEYFRESEWEVTTELENSVSTDQKNITVHFNFTAAANFTEIQQTPATTAVTGAMDVLNSTTNDTLSWPSTTLQDDNINSEPTIPIDDTYMTEPTEESDITTTQTEKPTESQLLQNIKQTFEKGEDSSQSTPVGVFKLRGVNACPVKEEVVAPFWANNTRGEVLALLNLYPFEQYVHWEKCTFEHKQMFCREGCRCEQQYRLHRLLAYDPNNECRGIFSDWFKFPSCCVCRCYDLPVEFQITSRSPRFHSNTWNIYNSAAPGQHSQSAGG